LVSFQKVLPLAPMVGNKTGQRLRLLLASGFGGRPRSRVLGVVASASR
jgi:hypothetical protein